MYGIMRGITCKCVRGHCQQIKQTTVCFLDQDQLWRTKSFSVQNEQNSRLEIDFVYLSTIVSPLQKANNHLRRKLGWRDVRGAVKKNYIP